VGQVFKLAQTVVLDGSGLECPSCARFEFIDYRVIQKVHTVRAIKFPVCPLDLSIVIYIV